MKILLISLTNNITNGTGNLTHELCSFLNGKVDFKLLLPRNEKKYDYTNYPVEYVLPDFIFSLKSPKVLQYLTFRYKTDADIIHSLFEFPYSFIAARISKVSNKPFIMGTQGTYAIRPLFKSPQKYIHKYSYNAARAILAPSKFTAEAIKKYSGTPTPIEIIHNGVNFKRFQEDLDTGSIRNQFKGKNILLTVGGLKARKGHDIVIKALSLLKNKRDDFHYMCIGEGHLLLKLKELIAKEGLEDCVSFLGNMTGREYVRHFKSCDIYVHTPILADWNFEGFGIVYLEASACRKPIIAADSGGIKDAVVENKTGLIVPENDPSATAEAIETLLDSPQSREKLGNNGWQYAKEHDWVNIGETILEFYKKILNKNSS